MKNLLETESLPNVCILFQQMKDSIITNFNSIYIKGSIIIVTAYLVRKYCTCREIFILTHSIHLSTNWESAASVYMYGSKQWKWIWQYEENRKTK